MSLNANALSTLPEAKYELHENDDANDLFIERRINALSQTCESLSGFLLVQRSLTGFRVDGSGKAYLYIPVLPVQSVSQIEIRDPLTDAVLETITDSSKFILKGKDTYSHSLTGLLQLTEDYFCAGVGNIALNLVAGFATTHPKRSEAQRLFFIQLAYEYTRYQHHESGVISRSLPDGSISFAPPSNLLREVEDGLNVLRAQRV